MEQIKKYIRGNTKRGYEVVAELEKLGGKNTLKLKGNEYDKVYYIARCTNTIDFVSEKSFIGQLIVTHPDWEEIELPKYKYPKTYEECCKVLGIDARDLEILNNMLDTSEMVYCKNLDRLLNSFRKLLICRDAYWKIAGEEMGLGKPWEPSGNEDCFIISRSCGDFYLYSGAGGCELFEFPIEEMRDAFKENFDPDLEICKELL